MEFLLFILIVGLGVSGVSKVSYDLKTVKSKERQYYHKKSSTLRKKTDHLECTLTPLSIEIFNISFFFPLFVSLSLFLFLSFSLHVILFIWFTLSYSFISVNNYLLVKWLFV